MEFICPPDHKHGENSTCYCYHRCRCDECRARNREYKYWRQGRRRLGKECPNAMVPGVGVHRRLQALMALGWSGAVIAERAGMERSAIWRWLQHEMVHPDTARRVREVYDLLWDQAPPMGSRAERVSANRTRMWAARQGFPPPMAWDDDTIDDPTATPDLGERTSMLDRFDEVVVLEAMAGRMPAMSPLERHEAIRRLAARLDWSHTRIAEQLGCNERTVDRVMQEIEEREAA